MSTSFVISIAGPLLILERILLFGRVEKAVIEGQIGKISETWLAREIATPANIVVLPKKNSVKH
jgi:hypothetical protein